MTELSIRLKPDDAARLEEIARQCGITPEEIVEENLREWPADERSEFLTTANRILHKNAELYRRLSNLETA